MTHSNMAREKGLLVLVVLLGGAACGATERAPVDGLAVGGGSGGARAGSAGSAGSAGGAGKAGQGGATAPSPVEECFQYCEKLPYRLPRALCEDWNRPGWEPQFCGLNHYSCADYCDALYQVVTPECAVTLPRVIRCVAPTYSTSSVPPLEECWLSTCRDALYTMTSACYGLREKLAAARERWQQSDVTEYRLSYDTGDARVEVVVPATGEARVEPPGAFAWTVPLLFDEVERDLDAPGVAPEALYDQELGYVVQLSSQRGCDLPGLLVRGVEVEPL